MSSRLIFTNTSSNADVENHYIVGSGIGAKNPSVKQALKKRASNNVKGQPCCTTPITTQ